jgi:hypothetical protein
MHESCKSTPKKTIPRWAEVLANQKKDGEKGVGDTLERIIKKTRMDALAHAYERLTHKDCGCKARKELLNNKYPYPNASTLTS